MTRLQTLKNRRERLINANTIHHYTQSYHPKTLKYYRTLVAIRKAINEIEQVNVRPIGALIGLTAKDLRELTQPITKTHRKIFFLLFYLYFVAECWHG